MSQAEAWANAASDNGVGRGYSADDLAQVVFAQVLSQLEDKAPGFAARIIEQNRKARAEAEALEQLRLDLLKIMPGDTGNTAWSAVLNQVRVPVKLR